MDILLKVVFALVVVIVFLVLRSLVEAVIEHDFKVRTKRLGLLKPIKKRVKKLNKLDID